MEDQNVTEMQAAEVRDRLTEVLDRASMRGERFRITRHGRPVAILSGLDPVTGEPTTAHVAAAPAPIPPDPDQVELPVLEGPPAISISSASA